MKKRVYIETTIPSYLAAWPARDLLQAARQQITHDWWNTARANYDLHISQMVLDEIGAGDAEAAKRRADIVKDIPLLDLTVEVDSVTASIMDSRLLPSIAMRDAIHIAVASVHETDFLLTWNCRHIANARIMKELEELMANGGYSMPLLCTPEELLGE